MIEAIGWSGAILSVCGALLIALNAPVSRYAFIVYLVASGLLMTYAGLRGDVPILIQAAGFTMINLIGIWRWFPRRAKRRCSSGVRVDCRGFGRRGVQSRRLFGPRLGT